MGQKSKIYKRAYLYVTDMCFDLLGNLVECTPSQVRSPSLQNGGSGVKPRENF